MLEKEIKEFYKYVDNFDQNEENIIKKKNHSIRVMNHSLNIAKSLNLKEDEIYLAGLIGLLHDIGRFVQYEDGTDHAEASADLAMDLLEDAGFTGKEIRIISDAIRYHRDKRVKEDKGLPGILYRADKSSRRCYLCPMEARCDWKKKKKNFTLEI